MYIYVLEKFINVNNRSIIYEADKIYNVSVERYDEIVENQKKLKKKLIRKATKKEIEDYLNTKNLDKDGNNDK